MDDKAAQVLLYAKESEEPIESLGIPAESSTQMRDMAKQAIFRTPGADYARVVYRGNVLTVVESEDI